MSDHLPECSSPKLRRAEAPMYGLLCICENLRAFEKRLRKKDLSLVASRKGGYKDALIHVQEAIEAIPDPYKIRGEFETYSPYHEGRSDMKDAALSVIDALRTNNSPQQ